MISRLSSYLLQLPYFIHKSLMLFLQKWFCVLSHEYTNGFQIQILFEALLMFNQGLDCNVLIFCSTTKVDFSDSITGEQP